MFTYIIGASKIKGVNTVPVDIYHTGIYISIETSTFRIGLNTDRTGHINQFRAIPVDTKCTDQYRKKFFFFGNFYIFVRTEW